ncbi:tryptophan aminotransferase-related protein 3-like [Zingiber officinale]|uniref:tryptophan aminotransferase-related protein 3-like n=1 Tax=Zingiber officinale TaxID=94328 RepID=UPI001C4CE63D|nr:tryptophan aminotransferase-related protein 3-like [Zingiber officinale]
MTPEQACHQPPSLCSLLRRLPLLILPFSLLLNLLLLFPPPVTRNTPPGIEPHRLQLLTWTHDAAAEAEAVAAVNCSGHGRAFLDGLIASDGRSSCECNTCYRGRDCSLLLPNCAADADSGDPLFLEPYWQQHAALSAVVVSGWHRMSYRTNGDNFISLQLETHLRLLHEAVGNAVTDGKFIVFGSGSTQLFNALIRSLSPDNDSSSSSLSNVVASAPYYPMYKAQTDLLDGREFEWEGLTSDWANASSSPSPSANFIEFVTSPNNPEGTLKRPVLPGSTVIHDHAYYWPHYSAIPAPSDEDIMVFTDSKLSGHASSRFGWVVIKDKGVYQKLNRYLQLNSMGVSRDTQLRVLKLVKVIIAKVKKQDDIFDFGYTTLSERWSKLNKILSSSTRFSLQKLPPQYCSYFNKIRDPSPAFGWVKCEREEDKDCAAVLLKAGIISRTGIIFEAGSRYTRLSLIKTEDDMDLLLQRFESLVSQEEPAVLVAS